MPRRTHLFLVAALFALLAAGCRGKSDGASAQPTVARPAGSLTWSGCGDVECATLAVPLSDTDPSLGTIDLALVRRPANHPDERVGVLLVNPGGPGVPGTDLARAAKAFYTDRILDRFDIIGFDPRGTGASAGVDCVDDLDSLFALDPSPDDEAERDALVAASDALASGCEQRSGRVLPYVSTVDAARDIERIRVALGEDQINWFGFSYGSELGATYATLYPDRVRAMVLDGAIDPEADYLETIEEQAVGLEKSLDAFLAHCSADPKCEFNNHGDAEGAFDALAADLDAHPIPGVKGRPDIGQGVLSIAVLQALYDTANWPLLDSALADARHGDGDGLMFLYDNYLDRKDDGSFANVLESFTAISCLDDPAPHDLAAYDAFAARLATEAPRMGPWMAYGIVCADWPVPARQPLQIEAPTEVPILVVAGTGDPITPIASSERLVTELGNAFLLRVDNDSHTSYGLNDCVDDDVDGYLIGLVVPSGTC